MEFLEYWTRAKRNREVISDKICSIVIESLKSFDSVQQVCCDVIRNISYDQPNKVVNSVPNLIQLLSSPTPPIVERSIIALRNCSEEGYYFKIFNLRYSFSTNHQNSVQARKRIQQSGLEKLISLLSSTYPPIVRASIQLLCTILSGGINSPFYHSSLSLIFFIYSKQNFLFICIKPFTLFNHVILYMMLIGQ